MAPVAEYLPEPADDEDKGEGTSMLPAKTMHNGSIEANDDGANGHANGVRHSEEGELDAADDEVKAKEAADAEAEKRRRRLAREEENERKWAELASAPKQRWRPTKYRTERPHPPVVDHRLEEEEAAHRAAQEAGYEGRRVRKFLQRRTVDYNESFIRWRLQRNLATSARPDFLVRPSANHVVELLPSAAYRSSAQAVTTNLVHSSTNKIRNPVNVIRWTPEGRRLLTGSSSGEYTLWNGLTFNFETILQAHDHAIRAIEYTKSGAWIVSGDQGGVVKYFQSNMNNLQLIEAHGKAVRGLSFSPDDSRFVTASDDGTLKLWSFEETREESTLEGHGFDVMAVDWHPYKGLLVSGSKDNLVKFWDPRTGTTLATYHGHKGTVQAVQWSNDGNLVATASRDQMLKLYDIRAMAELHTLKGHPDDVYSVTWHPDHRDLLVSGGSEGSMLFWSLDAANPASPVHSMQNAHDGNIWSLQWHPLGHILGSGSNDHTTRFWERARPEDGRLAREGGETDAQLASKQQRFNRAARGGGEEWDEENSFIPGLGSAAKQGQQPAAAPNAAPVTSPDAFALPGLGGAGAAAPRPPPGASPSMPPGGAPGSGYGGAYMQNGVGGMPPSNGFVPPPREGPDFMGPPREGPGFVPPPREGQGFVPPPRDGASTGMYGRPPPVQGGYPGQGMGGFGRGGGPPQHFQQQQQQQQQQRGFVPPPREGQGFGGFPDGNSQSAMMGQGFVPPPREGPPAGPHGQRGNMQRSQYGQQGGYYR